MDETIEIQSEVVDTAQDTAPAVTESAKPASMLEAMFPKAAAEQAAEGQALDANGQPRDPLGRFAPKNADGTPNAVAPATKPAAAVPGAPAAAQPVAKPADALAMPEGLTPKAQERFQYLANTNRELSAKVAELEPLAPQVNYIRETFQKHGIQQEQFEQAAGVLGMMNSGDFRGARDVLLEQLRMVSLAIGEPVPQVDALAGHKDLRDAVDGLQITEAHAIELARARMSQQATSQRMEQQASTRQQQESAQQAQQQGIQSVEALGRRLAATDLDWPRIEAMMLPEIQNICRDLPPSRWAAAVEAQYRLVKQAAGSSRVSSPAGANVLRPTGQASPASRPNSVYEAMWGQSRPGA